MDDKEMEDFIRFLEARQRLVERLHQVERIKTLEMEVLEGASMSAVTLRDIQQRRKGWKVGDEVRKLAKEAGMSKLFAHVDGSWLR